METAGATVNKDDLMLVDGDVRLELVEDGNGALFDQNRSPSDRPDWVNPAIKQLQALFELPQDWDGEGGERPKDEVICSAIGFLEFVAKNALVGRPHVSPTRGGGVLLEWECVPHQIEVQVLSRDAASYVYLNTETDEERVGALFRDDADDGRFLHILAELFAS